MGKLLYTINTVNNFMDIIYNPFGKPFAEANPDMKCTTSWTIACWWTPVSITV